MPKYALNLIIITWLKIPIFHYENRDFSFKYWSEFWLISDAIRIVFFRIVLLIFGVV